MPIEDYPYLAQWKDRGLDKRPDIPFDELVDIYLLHLWKKVIAKKPLLIGTKDLKEVMRLWGQTWKPKIAEILEHHLNERKSKQDSADAQLIQQARVDIRLRESTRAVMKRVADKMPHIRGGGIAFTRPELQVLSSINQELQACIKEGRRALNIPLKNAPEFEHARKDWTPKNIKGKCPWLNGLFNLDELPFFVISSAPADCALKILARRLHKLRLRYKFPLSTLKDILNPNNFPPIKPA